ncbi:MAG: M48 family metallopeptidase [Saprospiraceae bacterium]|nr:M48 family metallopeptidase [Saprospiraceae bacterium]
MPKISPFKEYRKLNVNDYELPVEIHHEYRRSARVSLAHQKAIVRIPILCSNSEKDKHLEWAKNWIYKKLTEDPESKIKYIPRLYEDQSTITVRNTVFTIHIKYKSDASAASGKRQHTHIFLEIPESCPLVQRAELCGKLISKIMAHTFLSGLKNRVQQINQQFFQQKINRISLRNNSSNWGSCSTSGNISLSTRLLLCPDFIMDYLIVHELSHMVHHNHSEHFWNLVEKVMPDYQKAEDWLKRESHTYRW